MRRIGIVAVIVVTASLGAQAQAQSLADIARHEAERRGTATESASTRVYTDADLRPARPVPGSSGVTPTEEEAAATATDATGPVAAGVAEAPDSTVDERQVPVKARVKRGEQYRRGKTAQYGNRFSRLRGDIAALHTRLRTISAQLETAPGDAERRVLQRDRAEVTSVLSRSQQNLDFLESEYSEYQEWAASKDAEPR